MIAVEALLGSQSDIAYKIALRFSCLMYPQGEARELAFEKIKKVYDERSSIVHGDKLDLRYTNDEVNNFEGEVRRLIIKFSDFNLMGISLKSEKEIDNVLFFDNAK